ncbi:hypothetical protein DESPIG_00654 [Desulfovibrio piger ATCC 29098]|uniref:Uncharacterized protein n=1 Tax=Desulfovibrio piger ATCC 29098 TaxID=411464 RepID=B6WRG3_9BACT|nr:hypothetical protein DESPIG_00654 [Desulfovibrio piger ATCC 29098]
MQIAIPGPAHAGPFFFQPAIILSLLPHFRAFRLPDGSGVPRRSARPAASSASQLIPCFFPFPATRSFPAATTARPRRAQVHKSFLFL